MNKKKISIFFIIILILPIIMVTKDKLFSEEDIYVLTEENDLSEDFKEDNKEENESSSISNKEITVYISGAVKSPGIVTLKEGDRLATAVEKVGGTSQKADLNRVNLAIKVKDEMHYIIPKIGENIDTDMDNEVSSSKSNNESTSNSTLININTATIEELDKLPGVGEATANKIVAHRDKNGDFKSIEEIKNVNGIGEKKFENMKDFISVK